MFSYLSDDLMWIKPAMALDCHFADVYKAVRKPRPE
jgi:hypothetical protein